MAEESWIVKMLLEDNYDGSGKDQGYEHNYADFKSSDAGRKDGPTAVTSVCDSISQTSGNSEPQGAASEAEVSHNIIPEMPNMTPNEDRNDQIENVDLPRRRKRPKQPENHKKYIGKYKRNHGEEYVSVTGKLVPRKQCSLDSCGCQLQCDKLISSGRRQQIFDGFYRMHWSLKNAFISGQVEVRDIKRQYTKKVVSRRSKTRVYRLQDEKGEDKIVCKKFFQGTLAICDGTITNALKRKQASGTPESDKRGKHVPHNKTSPGDEKRVCDFVNKFPTYESHYCRRDSSRKYLSPDLNMAIMFKLYKEECSNHGHKAVSLYMFRHIFNTKFNLHFKQPKKDTCNTCDELQAKMIGLSDGLEKQKLLELHELHLRKAVGIRDLKKNDIEEARASNGRKQVLVFDLQKTLPTPLLTTGVAYYKRQLWVYNLGVHDELTNCGHMYVWGEHIASRGPQEIASCLLYHIRNCLPSTTREIVLYSDSCGGQNRNIKMVLMLHYIIETSENIEVIHQKFFLPGHSFSTCDQDFGIIEREKKYHPHIFHPEDWCDVVEKAKKQRPRFVVHKMTSDLFCSTKAMEESITNRKVSTHKEKVEWLKIRWLKIQREYPKTLFYSYNSHEDGIFQTVDLSKKSVRGRPIRQLPSSLELLYPTGRKISKEKLKDLLDLMKYIPPQHHHFYRSLQEQEESEVDED